MTKTELNAAVGETKASIKTVLEIFLRELNPGQRKKMRNNPVVSAILKHYGAEVDT